MELKKKPIRSYHFYSNDLFFLSNNGKWLHLSLTSDTKESAKSDLCIEAWIFSWSSGRQHYSEEIKRDEPS